VVPYRDSATHKVLQGVASGAAKYNICRNIWPNLTPRGAAKYKQSSKGAVRLKTLENTGLDFILFL